MQQFKIIPNIKQFNKVDEFCQLYEIGPKDLLIISQHTYKDYLEDLSLDTHIIDLRNYGQGEPSDLMVEAIYNDVKDLDYQRVIAIGGGTILDVAKLFCLKHMYPIQDLFDLKLSLEKDKKLILVPTTCGTGSEVTNISILELTKRNTKKGLAVDAFIHAFESYLSPKASPISELFSTKAMELILNGYKLIASEGEEARLPILEDFLLASTYAGIAFGNAGCAPDIITCAKSIAAGLPLSSITARKEIFDASPIGTIGGTYCGNPVACEAALKVIEIIERDQLCERAQVISEKCFETFNRFKETYEFVGNVRGIGLMLGIEFVKDKESKEPYPELVGKIVAEALKDGLLLESAGTYGNVIRFLCPLVVTDEQLNEGFRIFEKVLQSL